MTDNHADTTSSLLNFGEELIHTELLGSNDLPWLVMCHGLGLSSKDLRPIATDLAKDWHVLLWDMPGHGESQPGPKDYHPAKMARILEFVIIRYGVIDPVLLGFSFGGVVSQYFIRDHPEFVRAFIAYACFAPFSQPRTNAYWLAQIAQIILYFRSWRAICDNFAEQCAITPAAQEQVRIEVLRLKKKEFIRMAGAVYSAFDYDPNFKLTMPTLLVRGQLDSSSLILDQANIALTRVAQKIAQETVHGAGHCSHLDQPNRFLSAIKPFLSSVC